VREAGSAPDVRARGGCENINGKWVVSRRNEDGGRGECDGLYAGNIEGGYICTKGHEENGYVMTTSREVDIRPLTQGAMRSMALCLRTAVQSERAA